MNAKPAKLKELFDGSTQHIIPKHQRKYSWTKNDECKKIFEDILTIGKTPVVYNPKTNTEEEIPHYLGAIVYKNISKPDALLAKRVIEDGQQRITSITLLALALAEKIKRHPKTFSIEGISNVNQILDTYVINQYETGEEYYKLILNDSDKNDLKELIDMVVNNEKIDSKFIRAHKRSNIFANFGFFRSKINKDNINDIYRGILRLQVIEIYLERYDVDQVIYETLNSTGKSLSVVDRVRNNLLMGLNVEEQDKLYEHYWRSMEILFEEYPPIYFDRFIRYYCIMKLKHQVRTVNVYRDFKTITNNYSDVTSIVKELYQYAKFFMNMFFDHATDEELKVLFKDFNQANPMEFSPFLMKAYSAYENNKISKENFVEVITILESYLMRRSLCGLSGNQGSDGIALRMVKVVDMTSIVESFKEFLLNIKGNLRFIPDEMIQDTIMNKDFCLFRRNKYVLSRLTNINERTNINLNDVDLIQLRMDSNLDEIYLTKIGNLSLDEIDLCMDVTAETNEEFIDKRTEILIDRILRVWEYPTP